MSGYRVTYADVLRRVENLNRRIESTGLHVETGRRNGYVALDEFDSQGRCLRTITVGTTREIADFLHAAMVGIDLSRS